MIKKEILATLSMGYCIDLVNWNGRQYCITASEERNGQVLLIDTETNKVQRIVGLSGGCMSILPIPEEPFAFLAIQRFFPIFDSADAEIVSCRLDSLQGEELTATVKLIAKLPYVHRIALTGVSGARVLLGATLCREKAYQEDWSHPGAVWRYKLSTQWDVLEHHCIFASLRMNHGMYLHEKNGQIIALFAGKEGVWSIDETGVSQLFCDYPISDLTLCDVDGDGKEEVICITPFHGNTLEIRKLSPEGWICLASMNLPFGHAVWSGVWKNTPVMLACSRGEDRRTWFAQLVWDGTSLHIEKTEVDINVGTTNISVIQQDDQLVIFAANHGQNEIAKYIITY